MSSLTSCLLQKHADGQMKMSSLLLGCIVSSRIEKTIPETDEYILLSVGRGVQKDHLL